MDPNFVQHSLADISTRFFGYLVFILAYSTVIHNAVRGTLRLVKIDLAKTWWDEAAIAALGIFFALGMDFNALFYIAGITNAQFFNAHPELREQASPAGWIPSGLVIAMCNIVTGAMLIGGRRVIVATAEEFQKGLESIKKIMDRKTNGASPSA